MNFDQLQLIAPLLRAVQNEGYTEPTPIQAEAIPLVLAKRDLLGCAQTGTGKTAAFALPVLQRIAEMREPNQKKPILRALVLAPTRELAVQVADSFNTYGKFLGTRVVTVYGGVSQNPQADAIRRGADVLVATPGRLLDLVGQGLLRLDTIQLFVLDEADRMLDMGFAPDMKRIISMLPNERQALLFSATMPPEIQRIASALLRNPAKVEVARVSSAAETVKQSVFLIDKGNKRKLLALLLQSPDFESTIVFTRTKHGADRVARDLMKYGIKAEAIHGDKSQNARQRSLNAFKARKMRVLVATDVASRGIDINDLSHVINFDIPNEAESYIHRIGRTGRAGAGGTAISFCDSSERYYLKDIQRLLGKKIDVLETPKVFDGLPQIIEPEEETKKHHSPKQKVVSEPNSYDKSRKDRFSGKQSFPKKNKENFRDERPKNGHAKYQDSKPGFQQQEEKPKKKKFGVPFSAKERAEQQAEKESKPYKSEFNWEDLMREDYRPEAPQKPHGQGHSPNKKRKDKKKGFQRKKNRNRSFSR